MSLLSRRLTFPFETNGMLEMSQWRRATYNCIKSQLTIEDTRRLLHSLREEGLQLSTTAMAKSGQYSSQRWQTVHFSSSVATARWMPFSLSSSLSLNTLLGQNSTHIPQPLHKLLSI